jgi:phosphoglycerate dehydrogenase-like enzyme
MQLLIYEPSYQRIRAELEAAVPAIEPLLMSHDGGLRLHGRPVALEDTRPCAAWANSDLYSGGPLRAFMIACLKSKTLRFVQSSAAGVDHPVYASLIDNGVALATSHASAISIAEFVIAAVFDAFQPQRQRAELQRARQWERCSFREISGTRWLVIGIGHIGSEVAKRARALGADVTGVRRTPRGDEPADRVITPDAMLNVVPECDVVVVCAPANRDSRHMIGRDFFSRLGPHALLCNIARGALLDEAALLEALERGVPALAILDVFETEPLPESSPLWSHPNVRISAHSAALGSGFLPRGDALFLANLKRFAAGEPPLFLADASMVKQSVA